MFTATRKAMGESVYAYDIGNEYVPHHHHIGISWKKPRRVTTRLPSTS
jgi:hypothetical protein